MYHQPINSPQRDKAHPLTILTVYTASGTIALAVFAIVYNLLIQP